MQAGHLYTQMQKTGDFRLSENLPFCLLVALAPKPLFQKFHFWLLAGPALFEISPYRDFWKITKIIKLENLKI